MIDKISAKKRIVYFLRIRGGWVNLWEFVNKNTECGFFSISARSRAQELVQEGIIEHKLGSKDDPNLPGKYSYYRAKPIKYITYKVLNHDGQPLKTIHVGQEKLL